MNTKISNCNALFVNSPLEQELLASVCFAKFPILGHSSEICQRRAIAGGEFEGHWLPSEVQVDMPYLAPIAAH